VRSRAKGNCVLTVDLAEPNIQYFDRLEDFLAILLNPLSKKGSIRTLDQQWGFSSFNLPAVITRRGGITAI
jgi:hypothetical protein